MQNERLQQTLDELNDELAQSTKLDEPTRLALEKLAVDIRARLAASPQEPGEPIDADEEATFADQLHQYLLEIETEHPRLTRAVNQVADALANLGI